MSRQQCAMRETWCCVPALRGIRHRLPSPSRPPKIRVCSQTVLWLRAAQEPRSTPCLPAPCPGAPKQPLSGEALFYSFFFVEVLLCRVVEKKRRKMEVLRKTELYIGWVCPVARGQAAPARVGQNMLCLCGVQRGACNQRFYMYTGRSLRNSPERGRAARYVLCFDSGCSAGRVSGPAAT
jgi:hypothetical protein